MQKNAAYATNGDPTAELVAANLDRIMTEKRWSGRAFAFALGLQPVYVQRRKSGEVEMSATDLKVFADGLEVSVSEFFKDLTKDYGYDSLGNVTFLGDFTATATADEHDAIVTPLFA